jgi:hypothetical protein
VLLLCTVDCRYANAQLMRQSCWIWLVPSDSKSTRISGKAAAIGLFVTALNSAYIALSMDDFTFVLRGWCVERSQPTD